MAEVDTHGLKELRRTQKLAIEELIARIKDFHDRVAQLYDGAHTSCENEESRMLLGILAKHQRRIVEHLDAYLANAPEKVLKTHIMYVPEVPLDTLHENVFMAADRGRDEIAEAALKMSRVVIGIYDTIVEAASVEEVREALKSLREFEINEMIYASRNAESE